MPTVSIVVPAYNAGEEIRRCLDSILTQEYQDFELLVMDDGSTDGTAEILDSYAAKDTRIRVVHKENTGVSDTRNQAMRLAAGEYLQFVDADDWISPDATKLMVRAMRESGADMVVADFYRVIGSRISRKGDIDEEGIITRREYADDMLEDPADFYYGVLWNKLYRRSIQAKYHLEMDTSLAWCEDFIFNMEYVLHCRTIDVLKSPVYYYVRTAGSLVAQNSGLAATVRMKMNVIQYYSAFYRNIYGDAEYATRRPEIYGFLLDFARDGGVSPFAPGTKKLGEESVSAVTDTDLGRNILTEHYYEKKLLEYFLKPIALQNDIRITDAVVLLYLTTAGHPMSGALTAEFTGLTKSAVSSSLQRLRSKKLVSIVKPEPVLQENSRAENKKDRQLKKEEKTKAKAEKKSRSVPQYKSLASDSLVREIHQVLTDFDRVRFDGFSAEERKEYLDLRNRTSDRIRDFFAPFLAPAVRE